MTNSITAAFSKMVRALAKPASQLVSEYTPFKADLDHMALGLAGEVGELVDAIKKHTKYNKLLDRENAIEELGDVEFYLEHLREILSVSREEVLAANMAKLSKRYPNWEYSNQRASDRMDKIPDDLTETFHPLK